jgi:hypothetical protein
MNVLFEFSKTLPDRLTIRVGNNGRDFMEENNDKDECFNHDGLDDVRLGLKLMDQCGGQSNQDVHHD